MIPEAPELVLDIFAAGFCRSTMRPVLLRM